MHAPRLNEIFDIPEGMLEACATTCPATHFLTSRLKTLAMLYTPTLLCPLGRRVLTAVGRVAPKLILLLAITASSLQGCAMVKLQSLKTDAYIDAERGDILTTGQLSATSKESIRVLGLSPDDCGRRPPPCLEAVLHSDGLDDERRLATTAELSVATALRATRGLGITDADTAIRAWLDTARYAYAYLFYTSRTPGERAFEERQTQVRDYYNYAVEQAVGGLFKRYHPSPTGSADGAIPAPAGWSLTLDTRALAQDGNTTVPAAILSASSLRFEGLRSIYRRDGFGSEMVAVMPGSTLPDASTAPGKPIAVFSEMSASNVSVFLRFEGANLGEILNTHRVALEAYDPYSTQRAHIGGEDVPLAGNFSAAYGVWLAQSGFSAQSLRTLFGWGNELDQPHIYLLQPYDPQRRVIVLLHGLASSPEAWVNMANELMGDERIRAHYQIWLAYYPTNAPLAYNHMALREAITATLDHYDPAHASGSARGMVLVGHSMGGVIARLMVSSSGGDTLWNTLVGGATLAPDMTERAHRQLDPFLHFEPMPEVSEAIFIAAPHRGTPYAHSFMARVVHSLISAPRRLTEDFKDLTPVISDNPGRLPTSLDNLRDTDPFIRATSSLAISAHVPYHTIVGRLSSEGPLPESSDGVVPYASAHLEGARSERVIASGHSVQETAAAILEVRRIFRTLVNEANKDAATNP